MWQALFPVQTYIFLSKNTFWRQTVTLINADLENWTLRTHFSAFWITKQTFTFKKMQLKMSFAAKCGPFPLRLNISVLISRDPVLVCMHSVIFIEGVESESLGMIRLCGEHDGVVIWNHFPYYLPFVRIIRAPCQYKDRLIYVWRYPC